MVGFKFSIASSRLFPRVPLDYISKQSEQDRLKAMYTFVEVWISQKKTDLTRK